MSIQLETLLVKHKSIKMKCYSQKYIYVSKDIGEVKPVHLEDEPRGTVNQELKLLTMHLILNCSGW